MTFDLAFLSALLVVAGIAWIIIVGIASGDLTAGGGDVLGPTPAPQVDNPLVDLIKRIFKLLEKAYRDITKLRAGRYTPGAFLIVAGIALYVLGTIAGNTTLTFGEPDVTPSDPPGSEPPTSDPPTSPGTS